jgi:acetylglutamate kinase
VTGVDAVAIAEVLDAGRVPVVATLGRDRAGAEYNVNADTAAGAIAAALGATKLVVLTDVPGIYERFGTPEQRLISALGRDELAAVAAARGFTRLRDAVSHAHREPEDVDTDGDDLTLPEWV